MTLKEKYNKLYRNLKRSVYGYVKRGISTSFFKLPKKPKRVTRASIRALEKSIAEWKYYTAQKLTEEEYKMLPANISRQGKHNISEMSRMAHKRSKISKEVEDAIKDYRRDLEEKIVEKNKNNEDYQKMIDEGYDIGDIPDVITNEAINLYNMAEYAYSEAADGIARGDNKRNWYLVMLKAEEALQAFNDAGLIEYSRLFSFNLKHCGRAYSSIVEVFDAALYDSEQLDYGDRFSNIMKCMIKEPKNMNARTRKEYAEIMEALGLT